MYRYYIADTYLNVCLCGFIVSTMIVASDVSVALQFSSLINILKEKQFKGVNNGFIISHFYLCL